MIARLLEALRFGSVGIGATLIHALTGLGLVSLGAYPEIANITGFGVAFCFAAAAHAFWTFLPNGETVRSVGRYAIVAVFGFIASALVMGVALSAEWSPVLAQLAAVLIVPPISYFASAFWAFRRVD